MRAPLARELRSQLEKTVVKARDIAEQAVREELHRLGVGDNKAAKYLTEEQRSLRNRLRAHGRQLGDRRKPMGEQSIEHLVTEAAYEHWHRMLFARFLAENNLLMYKDGVTALAIQDCFDLAEEETGDSSNGWQYAANYAAKMLPQIFRIDSPVFSIDLPPNHQKQLEQLLANLAEETFQAQDSLGWVYQFWQTKKKNAVNKSEVKIGTDELPAVTQLFTEPYMVSFLLDNSLGSWWISNYPEHKKILPLKYLRILEDGSPAAGKFDSWPKRLNNLKMLDPCCGSGHFLVATFLMLVPMRMVVDNLSADEAIDAVLSENIHGLELDQRCVELAAFAVALESWRYIGSSGYRMLPRLNIACVGQSINTKLEEWLDFANGDDNVERGMEALYNAFSDAPLIGSLINLERAASGDLISSDWETLQPLVEKALLKAEQVGSVDQQEAAVVAQGIVRAIKMLRQKYYLVITNVPYLSSGKMCERLKNYCERYHPYSKGDLANVFQERCLELNCNGGVTQMVMPQFWLQLRGFESLRKKILTKYSILNISILGVGAFDEISGEVVNVILFSAKNEKPSLETSYFSIDVNQTGRGSVIKSNSLTTENLTYIKQSEFVDVDESRILSTVSKGDYRLGEFVDITQGIGRGDLERFDRFFWELKDIKQGLWLRMISSPKEQGLFEARSKVFYWENGKGALVEHASARVQGLHSWGVMGVVLSRSQELRVTMSSGYPHAENCVAITPNKSSKITLSQLWRFAQSSNFKSSIKRLSSKVIFPTGIIKDIPLSNEDLIEGNKYPESELTKQYTDNSTQWIYHGHPARSNDILQVAIVRLLGYTWPAEINSDTELSEEAYAWIEKAKSLDNFVDDDGIVCLAAVRGEKPAFERLETLLHAAFGDAWSTHTRNTLLEAVGCKNKTLDVWLREKFFEQHCKLYQNRPFIWHIWDGLKDGFSALVNYHKLDKRNLERLIYTYLDDWLRTQSLQQADGVDGAAERLAAAENLKQRLEKILNGEAPYDIFVRWKPIEQQAIGWNPDINDGVRLNIRPFMSVADVGKKGAGILRAKPNIHWKKDRGKDVESAPWYKLGLEYDGKEGDRINDHHLALKIKNSEDGV